jgi:hypothetical protein
VTQSSKQRYSGRGTCAVWQCTELRAQSITHWSCPCSVLVLVLVLVRSEVKTNKLELVYLRLDWPIGHQKRRKESGL